jgi:hypothetical protein
MEMEIDGHHPYLYIDIYRKLVVLWVIRYTINQSIAPSTRILASASTHTTSMSSFTPWSIRSELCVAGIYYTVNWGFSRLLSA